MNSPSKEDLKVQLKEQEQKLDVFESDLFKQ
jgi:hypothetical protein